MNKIFASFAVTITVSFAASAQDAPLAKPLLVGDEAPKVVVSKWLKGEGINTFEKGHVYVIEFWATWCQPCIGGIPHLSELARKYQKEVAVASISILERGENTLGKVEQFVSKRGKDMDYNVGADSNKFMSSNWLKASGERGIPMSYIIDQQGRIAWIGQPSQLETALPKVIDKTWDIDKAADGRKTYLILSRIDGDMIGLMNTYMQKDYPGALTELDKILVKNPGIKYYSYFGHYTFFSLLHTDAAKAFTYANEWIAANEASPPWSEIAELVMFAKIPLPKNVYMLAASSFQSIIDHYPWVSVPAYYHKIAEAQSKGGDINKAIESEQKGIAEAAKVEGFDTVKLAEFDASLLKYKKMKNQ